MLELSCFKNNLLLTDKFDIVVNHFIKDIATKKLKVEHVSEYLSILTHHPDQYQYTDAGIG
jgi:hypothetical protein